MTPPTQPPDAPHELELIELLHQRLCRHAPRGQRPDYRDDCAAVTLPSVESRSGVDNALTLVTTDALCEGVHFDLAWDSYAEVGAQAAVCNLSDLAASGAKPIALLWSMSLPETLDSSALMALADGFGRVCGEAGCAVVGGNLCIRPGALELHVTAIGVPHSRPITRSGARAGDVVYVTGDLGERALGYLDPSVETRARRHGWRPHLHESRALSRWGRVSAMMDISDGLLLDASRLARLNGVDLALERALIPMSNAVRAHPLGERAALSGGEDYILLFTAPPDEPPPADAHARRIGICRAMQSLGEQEDAMRRTLERAPSVWLDDRLCEDVSHAALGHLYQLNLSS